MNSYCKQPIFANLANINVGESPCSFTWLKYKAKGVLLSMKMKLFLGLCSMLLVSMTLAFHTASAKSLISNEMNSNPFKRGSVSNGIWSDTNNDTTSTAAFSGAYTAEWTTWTYDNTKDYEFVTRYNISATGANSAAQLDLGLIKIGYIQKDMDNWLKKGISIRDGSSWQQITVDTTGDHEWRVIYKADKNFIIFKDGVAVKSGILSTKVANGKQFEMDNIVRNSTASIDYVRINEATAPSAPTNLAVTAKNNTAILTWDAANTATNYTVSRSVYANGPFTEIAKAISDVTFTDTSVQAGNTYYYIVKAFNSADSYATSAASNTASITFEAPRALLDVVIDPDSIKVGDTFTANIALKNVNNIYAEDFSLSYDPTLVEYAGYEEVTGYKVYNETKTTPGALRFIVASQGKSFAITGNQTIVKLKFKAIAAGSAKIDALKARIADTTQEVDLETANVLEDTVLIEAPRFLDVDRSGQYTLLDLSLDAFYFGLSATDTNKDLYDADQTEDNKIGDDDLTYIVNQIMQNKAYTPNK